MTNDKKKILVALTKVIANPIEETKYLTKKDLAELLNYVKQDRTFRQLKTEYTKLQTEIMNEFKLEKEIANSLINYALHV